MAETDTFQQVNIFIYRFIMFGNLFANKKEKFYAFNALKLLFFFFLTVNLNLYFNH